MLTRRAVFSAVFFAPLLPLKHMATTGADWPARLIRAARRQIGVTTIYDPSYARLDFPLGDVPRDRGVCTDVIIRAYRDAFAFDLQEEVNADMAADFAAYPRLWGLKRPDQNIDHRRVSNLERFFERKDAVLETPDVISNWQAGDLVTMRLGGTLPHIGIVSDRKGDGSAPLVIHNIGGGTQEEALLGQYENERRFRLAPPNDG